MTAKVMTCNTRYPILLVHGLGFRDESLFIDYWGNIPERLNNCGASVYTGNQDAFGSIETNGELLKNRITEILTKTKSPKINIIAHSKGGLESRYLISKLDMAPYVASLTTISTPHRGSSLANILLEKLPKPDLSRKVIDFYWKLMGDKIPNSLLAGKDLSVENMAEFNKEVEDMPGVYYQSYGSAIDENYPNKIWKKMNMVLKEAEGENDGLVSVDSCKWGEFRGLVNTEKVKHVSHADIVGLHIFTGIRDFDAEEFFLKIVTELKEKRF